MGRQRRLMLQQASQPSSSLRRQTVAETTFGDVLLSALGWPDADCVVLGIVLAFVLVQWHKRHRPDEPHATDHAS